MRENWFWRAWRWWSNISTAKDLYVTLSLLLGGSTGLAVIAPKALLSGTRVEKVAWLVAGSLAGALVMSSVTAFLFWVGPKVPRQYRRTCVFRRGLDTSPCWR